MVIYTVEGKFEDASSLNQSDIKYYNDWGVEEMN